MKPVEFNEQNMVIAKDQPQYTSLPAHRSADAYGQVIFCMGLSWRERLRVLFTGKIWCSLCTFGGPLTPSRHSTKKTDMFSKEYIQKKKGQIKLMKDLEEIEAEMDKNS